MLATASLGAIWSSCSPDLGVQGVLDRFGQIEPKVLFCADGYLYGGNEFDCQDGVEAPAGRVQDIQGMIELHLLEADVGRVERLEEIDVRGSCPAAHCSSDTSSAVPRIRSGPEPSGSPGIIGTPSTRLRPGFALTHCDHGPSCQAAPSMFSRMSRASNAWASGTGPTEPDLEGVHVSRRLRRFAAVDADLDGTDAEPCCVAPRKFARAPQMRIAPNSPGAA
jgi:hypothetical protein